MKRLPDTELEVMKALWASERAPVPRSSLEEALRDRGWAPPIPSTPICPV